MFKTAPLSIMAKIKQTAKRPAQPYARQPTGPQGTPVNNVTMNYINNMPHLLIGKDHSLDLTKLQFDMPLSFSVTQVLNAFIPSTLVGHVPTSLPGVFHLNNTFSHVILLQVELFTILYANDNVTLRPRHGIYSVDVNNGSLNRYVMQNEQYSNLNLNFDLYYLDKLIKQGKNDVVIKYTTPQGYSHLLGLKHATSPFLIQSNASNNTLSACTLIQTLKLINVPVFIVLGVDKNIEPLIALLKANHSLSKAASKQRIIATNKKVKDISFESTQLRLVDPITLARIKIPVRFEICSHFDCFDFSTLPMFSKIGGASCLICNRIIDAVVSISDFKFKASTKKVLDKEVLSLYSKPLLALLVFDEYLLEILHSTDKDSVILNEKGEWKDMIVEQVDMITMQVPIQVDPQNVKNNDSHIIDLTGGSEPLKGMNGDVISLI